MLVIYILITCISCMESTVSSVEHNIPVYDLQQHVTMNEVVRDNLTGNPSVTEIDLFRRQLFHNISPIDSQDIIDKMNVLLSLSSISLEDHRGGNAENCDFLQLRIDTNYAPSEWINLAVTYSVRDLTTHY